MRPKSVAALSTFLRSATPSPMPMLITILSRVGSECRFFWPNCSASLPRIVSSYSTLRRAGTFGSGARGAAGLPALASAAPFSVLACLAAFLPSFSALTACSALSGREDLSGFACFSSLSAIDLYSRTPGNAHLLAIVTLANNFEADAGPLAVLWIRQRDIRQVDRRLLGNDAAVLRLALLLVALD